jgi:transcriptional regulator with XRE-family HTH domain
MKVSKKALRIAIARACVTQTQLAEMADVSYSTLHKWVLTGNARADVLGKVARALNVDVAELMEDEE